MRSTITPVDEEDTEYLIHPPRPLFPNVNSSFDVVIPEGFFAMATEDLRIMGTEDFKLMVLEFIPEGWFNTDWRQRFPLTVQSGKVFPLLAGQINFQMLIDSTFPTLIGQTQNQIRFALGGSEPTPQLKYEIEEFDSSTGKLVAWVEIPLLKDDTIIDVYYDNSFAPSDDSNGADVFKVSNTNVSVYHMNQKTFGANSTLDSTGANNDATPQNMAVVNQVTGKLNGSLSFDGVNESSNLGVSTLDSLLPNDITVSCWVKPNAFTTIQRMISSTTNGFSAGIQNATTLIFTTLGVKDYILTVPTISTTQFTHLTYILKSNLDVDFYINGVFVGTDDHFAGGPVGNNYFIGRQSINEFFNGIIDELRVYDTSLDADKIKTIFNNEDDAGSPSTPGFYSVGNVQIIP